MTNPAMMSSGVVDEMISVIRSSSPRAAAASTWRARPTSQQLGEHGHEQHHRSHDRIDRVLLRRNPGEKELQDPNQDRQPDELREKRARGVEHDQVSANANPRLHRRQTLRGSSRQNIGRDAMKTDGRDS